MMTRQKESGNMLWLRAKKERKFLRRTRQVIVRLLLVLVIFFGLGAASAPSERALLVQVDQTSRGLLLDLQPDLQAPNADAVFGHVDPEDQHGLVQPLGLGVLVVLFADLAIGQGGLTHGHEGRQMP